ncbi:MAG: beta-N-acetylhexosaminidase [Verrucomicrobiota bacterium]
MKTKIAIAGILLFLLAVTAPAADANSLAIIPWPQEVTLHSGAFKLTPDTRIYVNFASRQTGNFLAGKLRASTGYPLKVSAKLFSSAAVKGDILLTTKNASTNLGVEGYELVVATNSVVIRAPTQAGLFYGAQTLLQLLPPDIFSTNSVTGADWQIPCVQIEDQPRFKWRGLMLDVSRHFFTKDEVEQLLDAMALHKINMFHWHLVDDQGWRIEIKKYPKLTQVGAWRDGTGNGLDPKASTAYGPDGRYGGFYTQDDIREVVKYAAARHITIVPEIEMPGHATAALAAYPQFSCTGGPFKVPAEGGGGVFNPANDGTFNFLDDVLREVFQLFPGKYVHMGGDEVPKDTWKHNPDCQALMKREGLKNEDELQSWFTRRIERFVSAHGRTMIGWSEIIRGGLAQNAAVMDWIGGAQEAAGAGHDVVMTPTAYCYFDYYQSSNRATEPKAAAWGDPVTLNKVYAFEPVPADLPPQLQSHILGAQGNLWTEFVPNLQHAEYMIFPRLTALAEVDWSPKSARNFDDFVRRLQIQYERFDQLGVNYRHGPVDVSK